MMITTKGRYALRIVLDLASHAEDGYLSVKAIAARQDVSMKYMEFIMSALNRAGLVHSMRGSSGGYRLAYPASQITVGDVIRSTEGSLAPVSCLEESAELCEKQDCCLTRPVWMGLDSLVQEYFSQISISDILENKVPSFHLTAGTAGEK